MATPPRAKIEGEKRVKRTPKYNAVFSWDIKSFKKDESVIIPKNINYENLSGLSNEVKSKLISIKPKTLGQAIRIDGITPAAIIILLSHIKKLKFTATA